MSYIQGGYPMKKKLAILLIVVLCASTLTACGSFTCGMCGREKSGRKYKVDFFGETVICKDCYEGLKAMGIDLR